MADPEVLPVVLALPELSLVVLTDEEEALLEFALCGLAPVEEGPQPQPSPGLPLAFLIQQSQRAYDLPGSGLTGGGGGAGSINWGAVLRSIPRLTQEQADYAAGVLSEYESRGGVFGLTQEQVSEQVQQETQKQLGEILSKIPVEELQRDPQIPRVSLQEGLSLGWKHAGLSGALGGMLLANSLSDIIQASESSEDRKATIITGTNALLGGTIGALLVVRGYKNKKEDK